MLRIAVLIIILVCIYFDALAQVITNDVNIIPPSPNAAMIGAFGDVPINHSTGAVNMNIPVYVINEGDITWPISLNYKYSGFKPLEPPGFVGRGWVLQGGGVISRTTRGMRDEFPGYGYLAKAGEVATNFSLEIGGNTSGTQSMIGSLRNGQYDSEPDLFNFNFGEYSGRFFYGADGNPYITSKQPLKIDKVYQNYFIEPQNGRQVNGMILSFIITTPNGFKYYFTEREYSWTELRGKTSTEIGPSAWHLTKVVSATGVEMVLNYTSLGSGNNGTTTIVPFINETGYGPACTGNLNACYSTNFTYSYAPPAVGYNFSEERFLTSIELVNGFTKVEFVSNIIVDNRYQLSNNLTNTTRRLQDIVLKNKITNQIQFVYHLDQSPDRLQNLKQFPDLNFTGVPNQSYYFEYEGFLNQNLHNPANCDLDYWGYKTNKVNSVTFIPELGADRHPYFNETTRDALKKVTYPTGGFTTFEYEPNIFNYSIEGENTGSEVINSVYQYSYLHSNPPQSGSFSPNFNVGITTDYVFQYTAGCLTNNYTYTSLVSTSLTGTLNPGITYDGYSFITPSLISQYSGSCTSGSTLQINGKVNVPTLINTNGNRTGPGIRVKKTITKETLTDNNPIVKEYFYDDGNTNLPYNDRKSSGGIGIIPKFSLNAVIYDLNGSNLYWIIKNQSFFNQENSHVIYSRVEEKVNNLQRCVYSFSSFKNSNTDFTSYLQGFNPIGSLESYDFTRGLLLHKINYQGLSTIPVSETINEYSFRHVNDAGLQNLEEYKALGFYYESLFLYNSPQYNGSVPIVIGKYYYSVSGWLRKTSEVVKLYSSSGQDPVVTQTIFQFDNPEHLQVSKQKTIKSNGDVSVRVFKFPLEYKNIPNKASFIQNLIDQNRVQTVLESYAYTENLLGGAGEIYDAQVNTFKNFSGNAVLPLILLPHKKYLLNQNQTLQNFTFYNGLSDEVTTSNYFEKFHYEGYNSYGRLRNVKINGNQNTSYLWAYNGRFPVAEISNANWSEVEPFIVGGENALLTDTNNSSIESKLDFLRASLTNALFTSYLHKPLSGIEKLTSPNSLSTYFTYDSFLRLMETKDHNQHIIKKYYYNYKN